MAEFEGYFHTTSANRAKVTWLKDYVRDNLRDEIVYGRTLDDERNTIMSMDRYNGSAAVMAFLAERFGEDIHPRLFTDPLDRALEHYGSSAELVFGELDRWLGSKAHCNVRINGVCRD